MLKIAERRWGFRGRGAWVALASLLLIVAVAAAIAALPTVVHRVAIGKLQAATGRPVTIETLDLDLFKGRLTIRQFRVGDRDPNSTLAEFDNVDARVHLLSLLRGHLWVRELSIRGSRVNVVRTGPDEFNISDLIPRTEGSGRPLDVTVDRFNLADGTVTLEDRVLKPARTWRSENIAIEAHDVSTRRTDGRAVGSSLTAGAPVAIQVEDLRLRPVHLRASITVQNLDLALVRLYTPPDAPVAVDRGRLGATVTVLLDARDGLRLDADAQVADAVFVRPGSSDPVMTNPAGSLRLTDLAVGNGSFRLGRLEVSTRGAVFDRRVTPATRYDIDRMRASAEGLTWPVTSPARIVLESRVPGGGQLDIRGTVRMQPAPAADATIRLSGAELAAWSQFLPTQGRLTGQAATDLAVTAELGERIRARATGTVSVSKLALTDAGRRLAAVDRVDVTGVTWEWPSSVSLDGVRVRGPSVTLERDAAGGLPLLAMLTSREPGPVGTPQTAPARPPGASALDVAIGEILVHNGAVAWRDAAVSPAARVDLSGIEVGARGARWPWRDELRVQLRTLTPGGGEVSAKGTVRLEPVTADARVTLKGVELAPYRPYLPVTGELTGRSSGELSVVLSRISPLEATVSGRADVSRVLLGERGRPRVAIGRAEAAGLQVEWPRRVLIERLTVREPSAVVERKEDGSIPLRSIVRTGAAASPSNPRPAAANAAGVAEDRGKATGTGEPIAVEIRQLDLTRGRVIVIDRTVVPSYAEDLSDLTIRLNDIATASSSPVRLAISGRLGTTGALQLQGRITPFGGALSGDLTGQVRDFDVRRVNRYLERAVAWSARDGRLSMKLRCTLEDGELRAKTDINLAQLQVVRAGQDDEAQRRIGLPLGLIVALMKNSRGEIQLSLPVGGRLNDPRFEFSEAIWDAVRAVAVKTITAPVSWIGRVHLTRDSKVEDITVNPTAFERGLATPTTEGEEQLARVAAFLKQRPDVRMVITPVITLGDVDQLKRAEVRGRIERLAKETGVPLPDAAARVFAQQFPGRPTRGTVDEIVAAVSAEEEPSESAAVDLAKQRVEAVRRALKNSDVDPRRLEANKDIEALETTGGGRVDFLLTDQVKPRRTLLAELLRKLKAMVARTREPAPRT